MFHQWQWEAKKQTVKFDSNGRLVGFGARGSDHSRKIKFLFVCKTFKIKIFYFQMNELKYSKSFIPTRYMLSCPGEFFHWLFFEIAICFFLFNERLVSCAWRNEFLQKKNNWSVSEIMNDVPSLSLKKL